MESQYTCKLPEPLRGSVKLTTTFVKPNVGITQINLWADQDDNGWPDKFIATIKGFKDPDGSPSTTVSLGHATFVHGNIVQIVWRIARVPKNLAKVELELALRDDGDRSIPLLDGDVPKDKLAFEAAFAHENTRIQEFQTTVRFT